MEKTKFKSGMVSIVGRPNVGKSTLLNRLLGQKVAIVSKVPQTTRHQIRGIYNDKRGQIVFIDTPGFHRGKDKLDEFMNNASSATFDSVDCLIYLVDTTRRIGKEEEAIAQQLKDVKGPLILAFNKVDLKKDSEIPEYISFWEKVKGQPVTDMKKFSMIALSAQEGINIDKLIDLLFEYLPDGPALYPEDQLSDIPQKLVMAETIREKLFGLLREELPHSVGVVIEDIQTVKKILRIKALIYVERESHKEIVIGKKGQMLKTVGTLARHELESMLKTKIFLEIFVKVQENWRDDVGLLQEFGYSFT